MKFKIGDKVKMANLREDNPEFLSGLEGHIEDIDESDNDLTYQVSFWNKNSEEQEFWWCREDELELISEVLDFNRFDLEHKLTEYDAYMSTTLDTLLSGIKEGNLCLEDVDNILKSMVLLRNIKMTSVLDDFDKGFQQGNIK